MSLVAPLALGVLILACTGAILRAIHHLRKEAHPIMAKLDDITAAVTAEKTAAASAVVLLTQLKSKLDDAILADDDGVALESLSNELGANTQALAAAVVANTPAAAAPSAPVAADGATSSAHPEVSAANTAAKVAASNDPSLVTPASDVAAQSVIANPNVPTP